MDLDKLEKLNQLKDAGALTVEEFLSEKEKLKNPVASVAKTTNLKQEEQGKTFYMLMHLSQYANFLTPFAGTIIPMIMWLMYKDKDKKVDAHGREILNWQLSFTLYALASFALCITIIGIPFAIVAIIAILFITIIFPAIGGISANDNELYKYPLTIEFFKLDKDTIKRKEDPLLIA